MTLRHFPEGFEIRMRFTTAVLAANGKPLEDAVLACTTVGDDLLTPEVLTTPPPLQEPLITPGGGDLDVDPMTTVRVEFAEPVQPLSVGPLVGAGPPNVSSAIKLQFGPDTSRTDMPFNVRPVSIFDLSIYELIRPSTSPAPVRSSRPAGPSPRWTSRSTRVRSRTWRATPTPTTRTT